MDLMSLRSRFRMCLMNLYGFHDEFAQHFFGIQEETEKEESQGEEGEYDVRSEKKKYIKK